MNEGKSFLVDDNPTNLQVLVGMLGDRDYNEKMCRFAYYCFDRSAATDLIGDSGAASHPY
jgi:hypothetical protein